MPFVPVQDTVMVELFQRLFGQRIENTLYFKLVAGVGVPEVTDLWNKLLAWWTTSLAVNLSNELTLVGAKITDLTSATSFALDFTAPTPNPAGVVGSPSLPSNVALCVSMRSAGRGRSSRGRNYIPGMTESKTTGNEVVAATVAGLEASYNGIRSLAFTAPWVHVVVSRFTAGAPRAAGVVFPVTSCKIVDPFVDSQRRRLTGRGL